VIDVVDRYYSFNKYLKEKYGKRVQKITIDAAFTCPNRDGRLSFGGCVYCDVFGSGSGASLRSESIEEQVKKGAEVARRRYKTDYFIVYFQAFTNTYGPISHLETLYDRAISEASRYGKVVGLAVGTRPDCVPDEVLDLLASYSDDLEVWVELGVQSIHYRTLKLINRQHGVAEIVDSISRVKAKGLKVCVHIIFGLPGETKLDMLETVRVMAALGIDAIKIHPLYVVEGSVLHKWLQAGRYKAISMEDFVDVVVESISVLPPTVVIQRLTGEAPSGMLVAPLWTSNKQMVRRAIEDELVRRNTYQGIGFKVGLSVDELKPFSS